MRKNIFENEEELKELIEFFACGEKPERISKECLKEKNCLDCKIKVAKQSGIIRKSSLEEAREKTDEFINTNNTIHNHNLKSDLSKLIQSERAEADKILKIEKKI